MIYSNQRRVFPVLCIQFVWKCCNPSVVGVNRGEWVVEVKALLRRRGFVENWGETKLSQELGEVWNFGGSQ